MAEQSNIVVIGRRIAVGGLLRCCILSIEEDKTTPNEEGERIECKHCGDAAVCYFGIWQWFNGIDEVTSD